MIMHVTTKIFWKTIGFSFKEVWKCHCNDLLMNSQMTIEYETRVVPIRGVSNPIAKFREMPFLEVVRGHASFLFFFLGGGG